MSLPYNRTAVLVFLGAVVLSFVMLAMALIGYDWSLWAGPGGGWDTISWGMAVLGHDEPILAFLWGLIVASVAWIGICLAVHFWAGTADPETEEELQRLRDRVAELEGRPPDPGVLDDIS